MKKQDAPSALVNVRFALVFVASIVLMVVDLKTKALVDLRYYLESTFYPAFVLVDSPRLVSDTVSSQFKSRSALIAENEKLSRENYLQRADLLRLKSLELENEAMRRLLNSPISDSDERLFAEVINVNSDPYIKRIVVNKGSSQGVYKGMPVITDQGIVGQVIEVNYAYSRVLLLIDPSSAIPVLDERSLHRAIANGNGSHDELDITNVPRNADVQVGDILMTSGIGGVYPEGYPVAEVTYVGFNNSQPFADVKARPLIDIDKMRYVLMTFYDRSWNENFKKRKVKAKSLTDSKVILEQNRIKKLVQQADKKIKENNTKEIGDGN